MKKILVTGGAGFIGSKVCHKLSDLGHQVIALDNFSPQIHGDNFKSKQHYGDLDHAVELIHDSVTNKNLLLSLLKRVDIVIHLAAETGTGQSMYDIANYSNVNIQATAQLLDIITNNKNDIEKIVVASSRALYGEGKYQCVDHGEVYPSARLEDDLSNKDFNVKCPVCRSNVKLIATDEKSTIHPSSIYGITKQVQEQMVTLMGKSLGISTAALRYQNVYGPGQSLSNPYTGILSIFSTRILNGNPINIFEDGLESRDFIYIDDIVDATIMTALDTRNSNEVYNVGSGVATSVIEVCEALYNSYNVEPNYTITGNYRLGDIRHNIADSSKIHSDLDFSAKVSFEQGIKEFTNWVQGQEVNADLFESSMNDLKSRGLLK